MKGPPGYLSKEQAAARLGVGVKTLDRRLKTEPMLANATIRAGRRLWIAEERVRRFFDHAQQRGCI